MNPSPARSTRGLTGLSRFLLTVFVACASCGAASADPSAAPTAAAAAAVQLGLENVAADSALGTPVVAFENRRYRHSLDALGWLDHAVAQPYTAIERRLGVSTAAITRMGSGDSERFLLRFPSDRDFPRPPAGPVQKPTRRSVDFLLRPNFSYELGRVTAPIQVQVQAEPMIRWNAWPGARLTASVRVPLYNQFDFDSRHPDVENVRPGVITFEQFKWIPRGALVSGTVGLLGENRYGGSVGAARPFQGGRFLADAQVDVTGFVAFEDAGLKYSSATTVSGFGGVSWSMPRFDSVLRLRGGRFLYGDKGAQLEFRRTFGDFEYSLAVQRSEGRNVQIVRLTLPVPPMTRATQQRVRVQPIERWSLNYRTDATPLGVFVPGVASREDYLRQLSETGLEANRFRIARAGARQAAPRDTGEVQWVNAGGVTGFIFTPWAGALAERTISISYTDVPAKWSYSGRDVYVNQAYAMTIGLLPRIEATVRFTRIPGDFGFIDDVDNQLTTDTDHQANGRLVVLTPRNGRPGLALGIEDVSGTRRFHSTYAVVGMPLKIKLMQTRFSLGYAPRVFTAALHVLDGGFGAIEVSPWRAVAARVEYDSEKWNVGSGVVLPLGLQFRVSALNLETLSVGAGWTHKL